MHKMPHYLLIYHKIYVDWSVGLQKIFFILYADILSRFIENNIKLFPLRFSELIFKELLFFKWVLKFCHYPLKLEFWQCYSPPPFLIFLDWYIERGANAVGISKPLPATTGSKSVQFLHPFMYELQLFHPLTTPLSEKSYFQ